MEQIGRKPTARERYVNITGQPHFMGSDVNNL